MDATPRTTASRLHFALGQTESDCIDALKHPRMEQITELDLSNIRIGAPTLRVLEEGEHLCNVCVLSLAGNTLTLEQVKRLASSPNLQRVTTLDLRGCQVDAQGAETLARSPCLERLETLWLGDPAAASAFARAWVENPSHRQRSVTVDGTACRHA